jgi:hypothetical protein
MLFLLTASNKVNPYKVPVLALIYPTIPMKDPKCVGEIVPLTSTLY